MPTAYVVVTLAVLALVIYSAGFASGATFCARHHDRAERAREQERERERARSASMLRLYRATSAPAPKPALVWGEVENVCARRMRGGMR